MGTCVCSVFFVVPFEFLLFSFFELCRFDAKPKALEAELNSLEAKLNSLEAKLNSLEAEPCVMDVVVPNRVNRVVKRREY